MDEAGMNETGRARRQKHDKTGRFAALQKLKELKGSKNKIEIGELDDVYEEVDEREYAKRVQKRQEDDWIIDDDGSGYVEDGREVFDDDLNEDQTSKVKGSKTKGKKKEARNGGPVKTSNIKNMFLNIPSKNKEKEAKISDDDILGDIMQELHSASPLQTTTSMPGPKRKMTTPSGLGLRKAPTPSSLLNRTPTSVPRPAGNPSVSRMPNIEPKRLQLDSSHEDSGACHQDIDEYPSQEDSAPLVADDESMDIDEFPSQAEVDNLTSQVDATIKSDIEDSKDFVVKAEVPSLSISDLTSGWETIKGNALHNEQIANAPDLSTSDLPLIKGEAGEQTMSMYWLDAFEDPYLQPGTVYLFGKVFVESANSYVSCCVAVKNIERNIFILPRDSAIDLKTGQDLDKQVSFMDVYEEFNTRVAERYKILQFKSRRVTKKYAFEPPTIPRESEYLEVKYSPEYPVLPSNLKGSTFSNIFGTNQSSLENLLLTKRIKGPCWLNIKNPLKANPSISWCKVEAVVTNMDQIELAPSGPSPPLSVMSLTLRTVVNSRSQQVEIVSATCLVNHQIHIDKAAPQHLFQQHFCILSRPSEEAWPLDHRDAFANNRDVKIERAESERALLSLLLTKINKIDPDIVVGHDIGSFDLDILLHRFGQTKVENWSRLGRLRRSHMPQSKNNRSHLAMTGRLLCDVKVSARELIRARSYDLETLCQQVLNIVDGGLDRSSEAIKRMYSNSQKLLAMVVSTVKDGIKTLRLMYELNILPLALQITTIAGNLMSRTLLGGRSERNEYLLLHAFHERGYIVPDRQLFDKKNHKVQNGGSDNEEEMNDSSKANRKGRRKPAYTGGLVLDPKRGFYDKYILLMDFNSLYPSIIQEFNICFTTVDRQVTVKTEGDEEILPDLPDPSLPAGVLPTEIRKLVDSRREVKKLIKDNLPKDLMLQYDIRQKALKLTANSMYGCLGFSHSRFYAKPLAALITAKGREILLQTRELVRKLNLDVIYGDTDSLMIDSNSNDFDQVMKLGSKIKLEVNKLYKHLELDVDGVFQRLLLLKKKKYAAVTVSKGRDGTMITQQEIKGLDIVRRDWSQLAIQSGKFALEQILSNLPPDERVAQIQRNLETIREDFANNAVPLSLLEITKQLTKNPESYPDGKNLSHVQVAIRVNSRGGKKLIQGDTVSYIICQDGSNLPATQRAYTIEEINQSDNLKPDVQYYLAQQVHPVVSRLCELLEGIDNVRIAEFLGLDPSGYRASNSASRSQEDDTGAPPMSDEERFAACERFQFKCPAKDCGIDVVMDSVFRHKENGGVEFFLAHCANPKCSVPPTSYTSLLMNRLSQTIRGHIQRYYSSWLVCEDQSCGTRTRRLPLKFERAFPRCIGCSNAHMDLEYNDSQLYTQLCFYQHIFDVQKAQGSLQSKQKMNVDLNKTTNECYSTLKSYVTQILQQSSYSQVDLSELFGIFFIKK